MSETDLDLKRFLAEAESPLEALYKNQTTDFGRAQVENMAGQMVTRGIAKGRELDFILDLRPERIIDWIGANPDVKEMFEKFHSMKYLTLALATRYQLDHSKLTRSLRKSPVRPFIGAFTQNTLPWNFTDIPMVIPLSKFETDISNFVREDYIDRDFQRFSIDPDGYLSRLSMLISQESNGQERNILGGVRDFYTKVKELEFQRLRSQLVDRLGNFRRDSNGREIMFPSDHQKAAIVKAAEEGSFAVFDQYGSGKTGIGIGAVEYQGLSNPLVICPAGVRDTWMRRVDEYYIENPGVIMADGRSRFNGEESALYTLVGYESLVDSSRSGGLSMVAERLLEREFDYLILDEAHYINNPNLRSDAVIELAKRIDRKLILTATPIRKYHLDLARIIYLLAPNEFPSPEALLKAGRWGVPIIAEILATKSIRRKTIDLVELPPFCPENNGEINFDRINLNPTQQAVYDAVFEDSSLGALTKMRLLRLAAINHHLVRVGGYKVPFDSSQSKIELQRAFRTWKKQSQIEDVGEFNSDYLVTHGFKHIFLSGHLHFKRGFDQFIEETNSDEIRKAWSGVVEATKFVRLKEKILSRRAIGEKIVVFSGHFMKGITKELFDEDGKLIVEDLYRYLRKELPDINFGFIDGNISLQKKRNGMSPREVEKERWQSDPSYGVLITNVDSSALGIDLTINDGVTTGVSVFGIDLPLTYTDFESMIRRVFRFGQVGPVNAEVLEAVGTIDEGIKKLILQKKEIAELWQDGVSPETLEKYLYTRKGERSALMDYIQSPKRELAKLMGSMKGKGLIFNEDYLTKSLDVNQTRGERIAELYSKLWEYSYSGHTARLIKKYIGGLVGDGKRIVDLGSGPMILDQVLREDSVIANNVEIMSVDINRHMLNQGQKTLLASGYLKEDESIIVAPMSNTGIENGSCRVAVCSLAFHYSNSSVDRGAALSEANRILEKGGYYVITTNDDYLNAEQFAAFGKALKRFGFELDVDLSGFVRATDYQEAPYASWLMVAKKVGEPEADGLILEDFQFKFEEPKIIGDSPDKEVNLDKDSKNVGALVRHENFTLINPDNKTKKGTPEELIAKKRLTIDLEMARSYGWHIETSSRGDDLHIRKGSGYG